MASGQYDFNMPHTIPSVAQTKWSLKTDVLDWSMDDVDAWWQTLGPNAKRYIGMVRRRVLNGERLLKMKRVDFDNEGMESWLAKSFVQWVRDLKYDSPDPVGTAELTDIIFNAQPRWGPNVSQLIARYVRDNPKDWNRKDLARHLKSRGLKKIAKRVKKEKIDPSNIAILISDPKIAQHERDELQFLFPDICFYTRRNPHPMSWYATIRDLAPPWLVFSIGISCISSILIVRGARDSSPGLIAVGVLLLTMYLSLVAACALHPPFWTERIRTH